MRLYHARGFHSSSHLLQDSYLQKSPLYRTETDEGHSARSSLHSWAVELSFPYSESMLHMYRRNREEAPGPVSNSQSETANPAQTTRLYFVKDQVYDRPPTSLEQSQARWSFHKLWSWLSRRTGLKILGLGLKFPAFWPTVWSVGIELPFFHLSLRTRQLARYFSPQKPNLCSIQLKRRFMWCILTTIAVL